MATGIYGSGGWGGVGGESSAKQLDCEKRFNPFEGSVSFFPFLSKGKIINEKRIKDQLC